MTRAIALVAFILGALAGYGGRAATSGARTISEFIPGPERVVTRVVDRVVYRSVPATIETVRADTRTAPVPIRSVIVGPTSVRVAVGSGDSVAVYAAPLHEGTLAIVGQPDGSVLFREQRVTMPFTPTIGVTHERKVVAAVEIVRIPSIGVSAAALATKDGVGTGAGWTPFRNLTVRIGAGWTLYPRRSAFCSLAVPLTR